MANYIEDLDAREGLFWKRLDAMATGFHCKAADFCGVMMSESGIYAKAHNPHGHASGINQLMPDTARGLGFTGANGYTEDPAVYHKLVAQKSEAKKLGHDYAAISAQIEKLNADLMASYRTLDAADQVPWVAKYYSSYGSKLAAVGDVPARARIYTATFLPLYLPQATSLDYVITGKNLRSWAYYANAAFDKNGDGEITIKELDDAIQRACHGPRWDAIASRLLGVPMRSELPAVRFDLKTVIGIQRALIACGYMIAADGALGPKTFGAIVDFQRAHSLPVDALVPQVTRDALASELQTRGIPVDGVMAPS